MINNWTSTSTNRKKIDSITERQENGKNITNRFHHQTNHETSLSLSRSRQMTNDYNHRPGVKNT